MTDRALLECSRAITPPAARRPQTTQSLQRLLETSRMRSRREASRKPRPQLAVVLMLLPYDDVIVSPIKQEDPHMTTAPLQRKRQLQRQRQEGGQGRARGTSFSSSLARSGSVSGSPNAGSGSPASQDEAAELQKRRLLEKAGSVMTVHRSDLRRWKNDNETESVYMAAVRQLLARHNDANRKLDVP